MPQHPTCHYSKGSEVEIPVAARATLASPASRHCHETEGNGATVQGLVRAAGFALGTTTVTLTNAEDGVRNPIPILSL